MGPCLGANQTFETNARIMVVVGRVVVRGARIIPSKQESLFLVGVVGDRKQGRIE